MNSEPVDSIVRFRLMVTVAAALAGLALLLASCGSSRPSEVSQRITASDGGTASLGDEVTLTIPAGALTTDATLTIIRMSDEESSVADEAEAMQPAGHSYGIDLGGAELTAPATLEIAFDPELLPSEMSADGVFLAYFSDVDEQWVPVFGTADADQHTITVETDHLSLWSPVTWVIDELTEKIESGVERLLELAGLPEAQGPDCALPPADVTVDLNDALLGCIEAGDSGEEAALVKLVNNRYYSISVGIPASAELARAIEPGSLSDLIGKHLNDLSLLGPGEVYVPPSRQAEFTLLLQDPGEYRFEASSSMLVLGIDFVLIWLGALGVGDVDLVLNAIDCLIGAVSDESLNTALDLWDVARECAFAVAELGLGSVFGVVIALLKTAVKAPALADLLLDDFVNGSAGRLTVAYEPAPSPAAEPPPPTTEPQSLGPITFAGVGCETSPLPPEPQLAEILEDFSDSRGVCYNFVFTGFSGTWPLVALDVIDSNGTHTHGDPPSAITGDQSGNVPDPFGLIIFFSASTFYPTGEWRLYVLDEDGHEAAASFIYP